MCQWNLLPSNGKCTVLPRRAVRMFIDVDEGHGRAPEVLGLPHSRNRRPHVRTSDSRPVRACTAKGVGGSERTKVCRHATSRCGLDATKGLPSEGVWSRSGATRVTE